jgi:hypothetical protein
VYDTLFEMVCHAICTIHYVDVISCTEDIELRRTLVNALALLPVISRDCNDARRLRAAQHAAIIGYERSIYKHGVLLGAGCTSRISVTMMDRYCDYRWFLSGFGNSISLVEGPRHEFNTPHPITERDTMWRMSRIDRYHKRLLRRLEHAGVNDNPSNGEMTDDHATTENTTSTWMTSILKEPPVCLDLVDLPSKVQTFVADSRYLFYSAYLKFVQRRRMMFSRCHNRTCDKVFFRGLTNDDYGKSIHSDGMLSDILRDQRLDQATHQYWMKCTRNICGEAHTTQLRRFCTYSCYREWRSQISKLTGISRIGLDTHSKMMACRMSVTDSLSLTLGEALRRNSRIARNMREAVCTSLPTAVRVQDRDDAIVELTQALNLDTALLMSSLEGLESNHHYSKASLPGSTSTWRIHNWDHALECLRELYRIHEPTTVLTSLMTRPPFFMAAVTNGPMLLRAPLSKKDRCSKTRVALSF